MSWVNTWTAFSDALRTNSCAALETVLLNLKAALDVTKYGYIPLGTGQSTLGGGDYTEASFAEQSSAAATAGQMQNISYRSLAGSCAGVYDKIVWDGLIVPADAAAATACTWTGVFSVGAAADALDVKLFFDNEKIALGAAVTTTSHATGNIQDLIKTHDATIENGKLFTLAFTTVAVSAGDVLNMLIYRNPADAADTDSHSLVFMGATLKYTRTV